MVTSKDDASILGGESDDVPSLAFIHGDDDEMIEHGIFPSIMEESNDVPSSAFNHGYDYDMIDHGDVCTYTSPTPTYDEMSQLPCEESHHHMSDMSDSSTRDIESISYERMSVTTTSPILESMPHILCEVV